MTHIYGIEVSAWSWVKWIGAQLTFFQFYTPQDLKAYGIGNPNGVLWMIPLMLCMYVLMRFAYPCLRKAGAAVWLCLLAALIAGQRAHIGAILFCPCCGRSWSL